ncbi:tetratricopeptide repeat protein [Sphingosinithalassobacter sp. CS137]|uniref:tetratricopeptide repeat protein n=1 Tax=Sphingosinithalassobacter sp. CS137 TaxID=2762748 RepID=UPI00165DC6E8|nr:tetratricopeptide repeat protein [Sphingosinithalassobacter sp. CS137]
MLLVQSLALIAQAAPGSVPDPQDRGARCMELAASSPARGETEATRWRLQGGGFLARQCLGIAYANQRRYEAAAGAFTDAAREAEAGQDSRAADFWAQAGNAWLAAGDPDKARAALDTAIAAGGLSGLARGEAHLDRARALVAANDLASARSDLDKALRHAPEDPLAWLLSATLARRQEDSMRARRDIDQALRLAGDDASVQLEAGNIAALEGDAESARSAWEQVIALAPGTAPAAAAREALAQFAAGE